MQLAADEKLIFSNVESPEGCRDALEAALEQKPECLLCGDDSLAVSVLKELRQRGISVPEDIRLASLYDSEILLDTDPTVTAVQFDVDLLGATACRILLDAIAGREVPPPNLQGSREILLAQQLIHGAPGNAQDLSGLCDIIVEFLRPFQVKAGLL